MYPTCVSSKLCEFIQPISLTGKSKSGWNKFDTWSHFQDLIYFSVSVFRLLKSLRFFESFQICESFCDLRLDAWDTVYTYIWQRYEGRGDSIRKSCNVFITLAEQKITTFPPSLFLPEYCITMATRAPAGANNMPVWLHRFQQQTTVHLKLQSPWQASKNINFLVPAIFSGGKYLWIKVIGETTKLLLLDSLLQEVCLAAISVTIFFIQG